MREKIEAKIFNAIVEVSGLNAEDVNANMKLVEDLGFDSLKFIALMSKLEEDIEVMVPYADMRTVTTVKGMIDLATDIRLG